MPIQTQAHKTHSHAHVNVSTVNDSRDTFEYRTRNRDCCIRILTVIRNAGVFWVPAHFP